MPDWLRRAWDQITGKRPAGESSAPSAPSVPTPRDQWTVRGIYFDTRGWRLTQSSPTSMTWTGDLCGVMTLTSEPVSRPGIVSATLPKSLPVGSYTLFACEDAARRVTEADETNNCVASSAAIVVALPDLAITAVSDQPAAGSPGTTFTILDTIRNIGVVDAARSRTRYYLSVDRTPDASDVLLSGKRSAPTLAAGASSSGSAALTVPLTAPAGTYHVLACADHLLRVTETSEADNCASSSGTVHVGWPDLLTIAVSDPPETVIAGTKFTVTDSVENRGTVTAGGSSTRYYLSADRQKDAHDLLLRGTRAVGGLSPAASSTAGRMVTVPAGTPAGLYHLLACADDLQKVGESSDVNNCHASAATVLIRN